MKNILILVIVLLVAAVGYYAFTEYANAPVMMEGTSAVSYVTPDGTPFSVMYSDDGAAAQLSLNGAKYNLARIKSASGVKYQSSDTQVVFWDKEGEVSVQINGSVVIDGAVEQGAAPQEPQSEEFVLTVAPQRVDCIGEAPMRCMVVNGEYFYDAITGFDFEPGFEYMLRVKRTELTNVPMDASSYEYELLEVLSKTPVAVVEASSTAAALLASAWQWIDTQYPADTNVAAADPDSFVLTFRADGTFSATTDCNNAAGVFSVADDSLVLSELAATEMACVADTQEALYLQMLSDVGTFAFETNDELTLSLLETKGTMTFESVELPE